MKKRLLLLIMILALVPISVGYAENEEFIAIPYERHMPTGGVACIGELAEPLQDIGFFSLVTPIDNEKKQQLYNILYTGMKEHQEIIDISNLNIPIENFKDDVMDVYYKLLIENPDIMAYTYLRGTEDAQKVYIKNLIPSYLFADKAADDEQNEFIEAEIKHYTDLVKDIPDTLGKMLVVHDELAKNIQYDHDGLTEYNRKVEAKENLKDGEVLAPEDELTVEDWHIYTAYGLFKNKKAVCQGYAIALAEIYERLGVEAAFCESESINHIWIVAKYNNKWYHIDPTWNDFDVPYDVPYNGVLRAGAFHNYFMLSTETDISRREGQTNYEHDYKYWLDEAIECTDKSLESGQIYTGDYIYDGVNYGSWYGTTTYENGRYCIIIDMLPQYDAKEDKVSRYIGTRTPLYSNTIKSYGAIASDIYSVQVNNNGAMMDANAIDYFINENKGNSRMFFAEYNGGLLNRLGERSGEDFAEGHIIRLPFSKDYDKVFWWNLSAMSPMCEAREIK